MGSAWLCSIACAALAAPIADYRDDFQATTPATGWAYQWNSLGTIGNAGNYTNLVWSPGATLYNSDGGDPFPRPSPGEYVNLNATGGHPGPGISNDGGADRYAIASYTVQAGEAGPLVLSSSLLVAPATNNGVDLRVYVNDTLQRQITYPFGGATQHGFNTMLGNLNAGDTVRVAVGPRSDHGFDGFELDFSLQLLNTIANTVANYRDDFQAVSFPTGWQYQTNTGGAIGNSANYVDLLWNSSDVIYDNDGIAGLPGRDPGQYVFLNATGGHSGPGPSDGISPSRFAIAAFTVDEHGQYAIENSIIDTLGLDGDGGEIYIHVNDDGPALHTFFPSSAAEQLGVFDTFLGELSAGDTIYIAVGPNGSHSFDNFSWNFDIVRLTSATVPEPASLALWLLFAGGLGFAAWLRRK